MAGNELRLWGIDEVAEYLGIPRSSVYKMTAKGVIPHVKLGGRVRFKKDAIERWVDLLSVGNLDSLSKAKNAAAAARR